MTPMFKQYMSIKEEYPDAILLFRMGDFYEMFFEDAVEASRILDITLTSRNREKEQKVPMCGVPAHAADPYISRLVRAGKKVAICEQVEDPKKAKGLVRREVIRVLTPGLITEEDGLEPKANNYLVAINPGHKKTEPWGLAYMDLSTGEFRLTELSDEKECMEEIFRLDPSELVLPDPVEKDYTLDSFIELVKKTFPTLFITRRPGELFGLKRGEKVLLDHFSVRSLDGFGISERNRAIGAAAVLLTYAKETQGELLEHIGSITPYHLREYLVMDEASKRNLELLANNIDGGKANTLLSVLDQTLTPMGGRLLRKWILYPLVDTVRINQRLDAIEALGGHPSVLDEIKEALKRIHDIERLLTRAVLGTINPREVLALKESLAAIPALKKALEGLGEDAPDLVQEISTSFLQLDSLHDLIDSAIREDAPMVLRDGRIIKKGFDKRLDELIDLQENTRSVLAGIEAREREKTNIPSLKIGFNKVFGYYIEVTKTHRDKVPEGYIRKQTLVNAERYITQELKELEERILSAQEERVGLEEALFKGIRQEIVNHKGPLKRDAELIAVVDCLQALTRVAQKNGYTRPVVDQGDEIDLKAMRHPVLEEVLGQDAFIPNDVYLGEECARFLIITGPNMAGKSTILRSTALTVLMAQMGGFVPCESAKIGVVDKIFTRVGATDYLSRGQSTFMVEMSETANILHNATEKSLVILDEIGRGTSTYDGLAIAWAVSEELLKIGEKGAKTLFATHYHELTKIASRDQRIKNLSVAVKEWGEEIIFLYRLIEGPANKSYGIQVAALAGVPGHVVRRAKEILEEIEAQGHVRLEQEGGEPEGLKKKAPRQLTLPLQCPRQCLRLKKAGEYIRDVDINNTTPLEALNFLAMLKQEIEKG